MSPPARWAAERDHLFSLTDRLRGLEEVVAYWVPVAEDRGHRVEALEARLDELTAPSVPPDDLRFVAHLAVDRCQSAVARARRAELAVMLALANLG